MRIVKLLVISVVFIFLLLTAMSLLIPSRVRISKAVNLQKSPDTIFSLIKDENKWRMWHPMYIDSVSAEKWENVRRSVVENTDTSFILQLQQPDRKPVTSAWVIHQYQHTDSVTLQWYMDFRLGWYPWEKFSSMFYEKTYGVMMEQGLGNIKVLVTKKED